VSRTIVVLHSGGMDSTTCLYAAKAAGDTVISLGVNYGQRLQVELLFAQRQCEALGVERTVINVDWAKPSRIIPLDRDLADMRATVSSAFLPGRNIVFLSLAAAHAHGLGADAVQIGLNCVDFSGYPDCTEPFFESFQSMLAIGSPDGPTVEAPLLRMSKREIAKLAQSLGIGKDDTWSCYRPALSNGGVAPCGQCDACRLHEHAWQRVST
jgi:7-cyano-7-deazaguanine synthase